MGTGQKWKTEKMEKMGIKKSLFVEAKEWFDKSGGNSYFSARIEVDGKVVGHLPFQYGYGSHFESAAAIWLTENGYTGDIVAPLWRLREKGIDVYTVKYEAKYRDVKRFGLDWREVA